MTAQDERDDSHVVCPSSKTSPCRIYSPNPREDFFPLCDVIAPPSDSFSVFPMTTYSLSMTFHFGKVFLVKDCQLVKYPVRYELLCCGTLSLSHHTLTHRHNLSLYLSLPFFLPTYRLVWGFDIILESVGGQPLWFWSIIPPVGFVSLGNEFKIFELFMLKRRMPLLSIPYC